MAQADTVLRDFILNVLSDEEFQKLAEKDGNQLYFTDLIEYYTKKEAQALMTLFRGQFANWESVPTSIADYASDFAGSKTPTQNNIMVVKDASGYATDACDILTHVQSTGTQYINLGIIPTVGMKYVASFQASNSTSGTIFGTDGCDMHVYQGDKNPVTEVNIGASTLNTIGVSSGFDVNYELTVKEKGVVSKASSITLSNPYSGDLPATEMYLLAKNTADTATDFSACIVKGFKVYEGETLLMDLAPARRVLDGAIGFIDKITNVFYENLGADPLIAGNVVSGGETPTDTNGSWLFIYNGDWNDDGKSGWTPAFALGGGTGGAGVDSVNGKTGSVTLTANDVNAYTKEEVDAKVSSGGTLPTRYVAAINGKTGEVFLGCREIGTYTTEEIDAKIDEKIGQNELKDVFETIYPVGSIYIGTQSTCPMSIILPNSSWVLVSSGRALWTGDGSNANTTIEAGLPNIKGQMKGGLRCYETNGAFRTLSNYNTAPNDYDYGSVAGIELDASISSPIYGNSDTVQPPAYVVNVWRRTE